MSSTSQKMLYHYHKLFLINHLFPHPDIKDVIKNTMNNIIIFISYEEYQYILKYKTLRLPNIRYELIHYDPRMDLLSGYEDIKYGKRAGVLQYETNTTEISFTNCYIEGVLHKPYQTNNKNLDYIRLKRNDTIML